MKQFQLKYGEYIMLEAYPSKMKGKFRWHVLKVMSDGDIDPLFGGFDYYDSAEEAEDAAAWWLENAFKLNPID